VLVASDAIGMGLNLSIRRIIFNSIYKNDGSGIVRLDHSAIKQISGRAGRRNSPFPDGEVTCRDPQDMSHLRRCMATEIEPISRAGLLPTASHIELFSETLEQYGLGNGVNNLHGVLLHFSDMATVKSDFFLCRQTPMVAIAEHTAKLNLSIVSYYPTRASAYFDFSLMILCDALSARQVHSLYVSRYCQFETIHGGSHAICY
jgi:ATP-dependent RNA helicase SUPV3L1/SUV3